jgi:hypothetical protein
LLALTRGESRTGSAEGRPAGKPAGLTRQIESAFYSLRHTLQRGLVLRSQDPVGIQQEIWAQLTVYQAIRRAMTDAVESVPGTDLDRAAFTVALETARDQVIAAEGVLPGPGHPPRGRIAVAVLENLLPARRSRTAPRKVKYPISRYASPPDQMHLPSTARITGIGVTISQAPAAAPGGRRDRTQQLLRTGPDRSWHASEIANGLGLTHHRGLAAELGRWMKEGMICRTAPATFALHPDWTGPARRNITG